MGETNVRLLAALRQSLRPRPGLSPTPLGDAVLDEAEWHEVLPLLYPVCHADRVQRAAEMNVHLFYRLLFLGKYAIRTLKGAGMQVLVLKGVSVARWYPTPELRPSSDVDLLLCDSSRLDEALRVLEDAGFVVLGEQNAHHHVALSLDGLQVELHTSLVEAFDDARTNDAIRSITSGFAGRMQSFSFLGMDWPCASPADQAFCLVLHALQHYLRSGFGLKILADWVIFWDHGIPEGERRAYREMCRECGILEFSEYLSSTCVAYLGMRGEQTVCDEDCTLLMQDILCSGAHGKSSNARMVALRGTGLADYAREFHHQMRLNYPEASRVVPLWPALWLSTLFKFFYNNRKVRHTTLGNVLAETRERSEVSAKMHLFERGSDR